MQFLLGNVARYDPTFVQLAAEPPTPLSSAHGVDSTRLKAQLSFPPANALVRAEVPLFGTAGGAAFASYRVEYGEGAHPTKWQVIASGTQPTTVTGALNELYSESDLGVRGNLATWDTGLRHYAYLPTHPRDHPVDLKGTHTVRLVVTADNGETVEDRVTVFVANVATFAWGGDIVSSDRRVRLRVPEHAVSEPFRLIGIEPVDDIPPYPDRARLVGGVYRAREREEVFMSPARLSILVDAREAPSALAIYAYESSSRGWQRLDTSAVRLTGELRAEVVRLHEYYAVFEVDDPTPLTPTRAEPVRLMGPTIDALVASTFEDPREVWRSRGASGGAIVERLEREPGNFALRLSASDADHGFGVVVSDRVFDVAQFPVMEFDYRIAANVPADIYVKANGRWYRIGFTDQPDELRNKRVNVAPAGRVSNVQADDHWHRGRVNLWDALRQSTGDRVVEQIMIANFDVVGTMRLRPGSTAPGAAYWIDNFTIRRDARYDLPTSDYVVGSLAGLNSSDRLARTFTDGKGGAIVAKAVARSGERTALMLQYVLNGSDQYAGYVATLPAADLRAYRTLRLELESGWPDQGMLVGVRDTHGNESKVRLEEVTPTGESTDRSRVDVPLVVFAPTIDWSQIAGVVVAFESPRTRQGQVQIRSVRFQRTLDAPLITGFENGIGRNRLGGAQYALSTGGAVVEVAEAIDAGRRFLRLLYGGTIGSIGTYASSDTFSHATWRSELRGLDCSACGFVRLRVRGAHGGERPNLYLDDGNHRWGVDLERYGPVTTSWSEIRIPLSAFTQEGIDVTHLAAIEVVFEWDRMSGALFLDDIAFEPRASER